MKKFLIVACIVVFMGVVLVMTAPPGDAVIDFGDDNNYVFNSKDEFRKRKQYVDGEFLGVENGISDGTIGNISSGYGSGDFVPVPVPDDLSQESLRSWLAGLSLSPERRAMVSFEIELMGKIAYVYGGDARNHYREDPSVWPIGNDCSGMVTAAMYRGGVDCGYCLSTTSIYDTFFNNQVQGELMPGDISVTRGGHTELYLGKQADGTWVHIGIRTAAEPPGPSTIRNHGSLISNRAIHVRPPQIVEADTRYYASGGRADEQTSDVDISQYIVNESTGEVGSLLPELEDIMNEFIRKCGQEGLLVKITSTIVTVNDQNALYEQGRTTAGVIVTNDRGSDFGSYHQWGLSFDICQDVIGSEYPDESDQFWLKCAVIGKSLGLEWGGDWTDNKDLPHFQLSKYGRTSAELKSKYGNPGELFKSVLVE